MNQPTYTEPTRRAGSLPLLLALLSLLTVHFATAAPPDVPPTIDHPPIRAAVDTRDWLAPQWANQPGILGSGIGFSHEGRVVIRLFTLHAGVPNIPTHLSGIPVHVQVTGLIHALSDPTERMPRPVPIGVSAGHPSITAGTIGARVRDSVGNLYALSNNHVFANSNDAKIKRDVVIQPSSLDSGSAQTDQIGTLHDFVPLDFNGGDNRVDAAIALSDAAWLGTATLPEGYGSPAQDTVTAYLGQPVQKCGRTTGCTRGEVSELAVNLKVCYEGTLLICTRSARFVDQIAISSNGFSSGGDSGSLIVTDDYQRNPVALLFAGSSTRTFGNPIDLVLANFDVAIDGDDTPADGPPPAPLALSAQGYKIKGSQYVDLSWSGNSGSTIDIWRNDRLINTLNQASQYTDALEVRGKGTYHYRVCEAETASCSNRVDVIF